tara:strand:- start:2178 stop:2552 length:375 start_codon:yes stop_codon:yes gene_type:complete
MSILITMVLVWLMCLLVFVFRVKIFSLFSKPEYLVLGEKITCLRLKMLAKPIADRYEDLKEIAILEDRYSFLVAKKSDVHLVKKDVFPVEGKVIPLRGETTPPVDMIPRRVNKPHVVDYKQYQK